MLSRTLSTELIVGNGTFWVLIDVGDILPHVGADGLCDNERANGFFFHIHNLEAAIILPLPVYLVTVHLLQSEGMSRTEGARMSEGRPDSQCPPSVPGLQGRVSPKVGASWQGQMGDFPS